MQQISPRGARAQSWPRSTLSIGVAWACLGLSSISWAATSTSTSILSTQPASPMVGQTLLVKVQVLASGGGTVDGTVTISDGALSCTLTLPATGCSLPLISPGPKSVTAKYNGNATYAISQTANPTLVSVVADPNDTDADGIPNAQEALLGLNPQAKDNLLFDNSDLGYRLFVMQQFRDLLYREGTDAAVSGWLTSMQNGMSRSDVILAMMNSKPAQSQIKPLGRLFFTYFGSLFANNNMNGFTSWAKQLSSGSKTMAEISDSLVVSGAFTTQYGTLSDAQFIDVIYQNTLGRAATQNEKDAAQTSITAQGRGAWAKTMSEDASFISASDNKLFVELMFAGLGRRVPTPSGETYWLNKLAGNVSAGQKEMAQAYMGELWPAYESASTTYHDRFLLPGGVARDASRFLTQATFGPTLPQIDWVVNNGIKAWLDDQFARPYQPVHLNYVDSYDAILGSGGSSLGDKVTSGFWRESVMSQDQLRHRVGFALSEIFVTSLETQSDRGIAAYLDMLNQDAFGNFRTLLEDVAKHPTMGQYLSHLHNVKEDPVKGTVPDENFAREIMQLFTIGLYELNPDGSLKLVNGAPVETYNINDVAQLAKVFTGWSWAGADTTDARFWGYSSANDPNREVLPMQAYPKFHSVSAKTFLGLTIPAQTVADPQASLTAALDHLFNHPNVGPFIGKQLIQRLVTSNPSPQYVARISAVFANNGQGVRGDMKAVIRAILMDPEARNAGTATGLAYGKLREPVLRLSHWMRAFSATSDNGWYSTWRTDSDVWGLGQSPMDAPSVFNFFRPSYAPPNTDIAGTLLVAPEFQITNDVTVASYVNYMNGVVQNGPSSHVKPNYAGELAVADNANVLVDRLNLLLTNNTMPLDTYNKIVTAVSSVTIPTNNQTNAANARKYRVQMAVLMTMASPAYLVQR